MIRPTILTIYNESTGRRAEVQCNSIAEAVGILECCGFVPRFEGADVYDHYHAPEFAVVAPADSELSSELIALGAEH